MNPEKKRRNSPILWIAPTALVAFAFYFFWYQDLSKNLASTTQSLANLLQQEPANKAAIQKAGEDFRAIRDKLTAVHENQNTMQSELAVESQRRQELLQQLHSVSDKAHSQAQVVAIFRDLKFAINNHQSADTLKQSIDRDHRSIQSSLDNNLKPNTASSQAAANLTQTDDAETVPLASRRQYEISVQGSFAQIANALERIKAETPDMTVIGVELKPVKLNSSVHNWLISLAF